MESMVRTIRDAATVVLVASALLTAGAASAFTRDPAAVFVNEFHYDNRGVDQNEAVELAGPAETDLTGWRLVLYNGSDSKSVCRSSRVGAEHLDRFLSVGGRL